ncbi:cytochrome c oxidase accessory protein CcoG [Chitinilyticum piscinae]|uniref:Cytochrome c oxidase accessory protein CcoG n=1 Tax=Chitinilyticum piscinae TaxID=2866724 RepID=A0A8J7FKZ0_9NEIS|nr:cytochrome c oxidase accessory protein CcoG [Chitinilyticum piscinae]MBE9609702.1 cytochrome c oxidase accessory protein CcoG [Chitinilyticum piscinae]
MSNKLKDIPVKVVDVRADGEIEEISLYAKHKKLYPRWINGFFNKWRILLVVITQLFFYGMPWLQIHDRQALLFNLVERKFYIFGLVLLPQDFIYLTALLLLSALGLFVWTAIGGRLWCGYACPQTVYTEIFLWIEKWVEGDRAARIKLDNGPLNARKLRLKATKHTLWILLALWTGFTFVGFFTPIRELAGSVGAMTLGPWETFWILFYGFATYGNAGWMREQVCKYMCPYARFQSAMFDKDTLIISYDAERGEPRGSRKKGSDYKAQGLGECIDCTMCVQVCPVGIDIRNGLQYECIGCAACIDACDEVMDKVGYPRGLVRYTTENALQHQYAEQDIIKHLRRPRVLLYGAILGIVFIAMVTSLVLRKPLKVNINRDRVALVRTDSEGWLENAYRVQIQNASEKTRRFVITVEGQPGIRMEAEKHGILKLEPTETNDVAVRVKLAPDVAGPGSHPILITVTAEDDPAITTKEKATFIGQ